VKPQFAGCGLLDICRKHLAPEFELERDMPALRSVTFVVVGWVTLAGGCLRCAEAQQSGNASVSIGGRAIIVPAPKGFERSDGINADWDSSVTAMLPATNRQLITFTTSEEVEAIRNRQPTGSARGFSLQVLRNAENQEIGERTFEQFRGKMRAELETAKSRLDETVKQLVQDGNKRLGDQFGVDAALTISDTAVLGFFEDSATSLGFTIAMKVGSGNTPGEEPERNVVAAIVAPVNGRLLYFYSTSSYKEEGDRKWAEQAVAAWRDAVVAANPRVAGPAGGGFDFNASFQTGLISGVVGGLVGAFAWITKRSKKRERPAPDPD
jgi:hypothetical protein